MPRPRLSLRPLPAHLSARYRQLGGRERAALAAALEEHYFADCDSGYLASEIGRRDRDDHLFRRLDVARAQVVPWLDAASRLDGARILEIGCGTGSATVALAEQGASVTGVDLCERSLKTARLRCELHGVEAGWVLGNATEVLEKQGGERFDFILFYASLEHMTLEERKLALRRAWRLLLPGALLGVVETPNRLWHHDSHTSFLPFFHWLPDDLAFEYSQRSPRDGFRECYRVRDDASLLHFQRRGRGVSYHEFELALGAVERLDVVSHLRGFQRARHPWPAWSRWRTRHSLESRYEALLAELAPQLHAGFRQPYLDLLIRKG